MLLHHVFFKAALPTARICHDSVIMYGLLERTGEDTVVAYLKLLWQDSSCSAHDKHEKSQWGQVVPLWRVPSE